MTETQVQECGNSSTGTVTVQGVALKSVEDIREPNLDPRISISSRPKEDELDEGVPQKISRIVHGSLKPDEEKQSEESEPVYVNIRRRHRHKNLLFCSD